MAILRSVAHHGLNAWDALAIATRGGAPALGLDAEIGTLEKGKWADLCCIDLQRHGDAMGLGRRPLRTRRRDWCSTAGVTSSATSGCPDVTWSNSRAFTRLMAARGRIVWARAAYFAEHRRSFEYNARENVDPRNSPNSPALAQRLVGSQGSLQTHCHDLEIPAA